MKRTSIELITGYTKTGKPQTKKYLAKPTLTLFDTIQGSKLSMKMAKAFDQVELEMYTDEEYEKLSETEKKEYQAKLEELQDSYVKQFEVLEELAEYISEAFAKQFTAEELLKGIENGEEGLEKLSDVLQKLVAGEVDDTKKFLSDQKK